MGEFQLRHSFTDRRCSIVHSITASAIPLHAHSEYVVGYYFVGRSQCRIGSGSEVEFRPGDLGILNPGEAHQDLASRANRDYITVNFQKSFFLELSDDLECPALARPWFGCPKLTADAQMRRICRDLRTEVDARHFGREIMLNSLATELAVALVRRLAAAQSLPKWLDTDRETARREVRQAMEYLRQTYREAFSLDRIASAVGLSKFYLERMFKRTTGLNLHTYLMMLRVEAAKQLLRDGERPLAEVALELGFSDQSHFTNAFKRFVGMTPHAYRLATR